MGKIDNSKSSAVVLKEALMVGEGIFAFNKPIGMTSHDVVAMIKKATGIKKVGHAGTLDPLAEGVLVIGVGRDATKQLGKVVEKEKEYLAFVKFGFTSTTDDEEGEKTKFKVAEIPSLKGIEKVLECFEGNIKQLPPRFSSVKIWGERAYKKAREGKDFPLPPRAVEIKSIEILEYEWPLLRLRVVTGPGVYIRSLARDLGEKLGVGGYLAGLIRTRVGTYLLENSIKITKTP